MCQHFLLWITALVSYLRTPHIGLDLKDFPLSFLMKILKLYIEIHDPFLINFIGCEVLSQNLIFLSHRCPIVPIPFVKKIILFLLKFPLFLM